MGDKRIKSVKWIYSWDWRRCRTRAEKARTIVKSTVEASIHVEDTTEPESGVIGQDLGNNSYFR